MNIELIICAIIICWTIYATVDNVVDKWDDEKRREHDRWEAEREDQK